MRTIRYSAAFVVLILTVVFVAVAFHWTVNRVYVPEGKSLRLRYKGPLVFGQRKIAFQILRSSLRSLTITRAGPTSRTQLCLQPEPASKAHR